jgi:hypothetical protein
MIFSCVFRIEDQLPDDGKYVIVGVISIRKSGDHKTARCPEG